MRISFESIAIFCVVLFGFLIRLYKLTVSPEALYIDETSIAYNAYSIISTGLDEHSQFMPLFFEAFGEYKLPVYIYLTALAQLLVGPSDLSVRIPSLIFGTLTIFVIYLFAKEILGRNSPAKYIVPVLSAFLLAVSPWHLQFSRPGFEASVGLFFLISGLFLFFRGINLKSTKYVALSFVSFVLTLYSYNSARIVTPVVILLLAAFWWRCFAFRSWIKMSIVAIALAIPFIIFSLNSQGLARARQVSIFFQKDFRVSDVFSNYLKNVSPFYLFSEGDPTIAHTTPHRMSLIYPAQAPFFFIGLYYLLLARSRNLFLLVLLFLISLVPPSLATLNPHALRGLFALSAVPIISAVGFSYFAIKFARNYLQTVLLLTFIVAILFSTFNFLSVYHNKYVPDAGWDWQVGIKRASSKVLAIEENYGDIYFDVDVRLIPVLWYLKIDKNHLGKYHIGDGLTADHGLYVGLNPPAGRLLEYVYYPNNTVAYGIWEF